MKICQKVSAIEKNGEVYSVRTDGCEFRIMFLTDEILRIRAGFTNDFTEESYSLVLTGWEDRIDDLLKDYRVRVDLKESSLTEDDSEAVIHGKKLRVVIKKNPFMLQIFDSDGDLLHEDIPYMGWQCDGNGRRIHISELKQDDCYYGFGERTGKLNKAGKFMMMAPGDTMGYDPKETDPLYKHIPFYIKLAADTKKACGYFYHTTEECDFNMGRSHSNYVKHHSTVRIDGGDIDLFFINGPEISSVIEGYTDLTGKSVLLPKAALGYLGSSMYYPELPKDADDAIVDFIKTCHEEEIPIDGFQLSSGYCELDNGEGNKRYAFTWNYDKFKDPKQFFEEMEGLGVTVSPNVKPGFLLSHPYIEEMKKKGMFIKNENDDEPAVGLWWGGMGHYVDLTNESTRAHWKEYLKDNLISYNVTSVWNDNCEYEGLVNKDSRVDFEGKGSTVGATKPIMSNMMCQLSNEAVEEAMPNVRPFSVCRSGHSGIQRYAQVWAGDNFTSWDSLKYNVATILGMGLSGVANQGCDIGGFYGPSPEEELFVRWVQNGIFQPRFSIHSTNTDNTVTEPWMYSGSKELIKKAIQFRYSLSPLMYSLVRRANKSGLPIMEPLVLEFQNDERVYDEGENFMLGSHLLVANVLEKGQQQKEIYFPAGECFYDFYTREPYEGGRSYSFDVTMESIPMFVRTGAIIPLAGNKLMNLTKENVTDLKLLVATGKDSSFTMYEDDGKTNDYKEGKYLETLITLTDGEITTLDFKHEGAYESTIERMAIDMIHRQKAPFAVKLHGRELPHFLNRRKFEEAKEGWYYSQTLKSVQIKYENIYTDYKLEVSFEKLDLIGM